MKKKVSLYQFEFPFLKRGDTIGDLQEWIYLCQVNEKERVFKIWVECWKKHSTVVWHLKRFINKSI